MEDNEKIVISPTAKKIISIIAFALAVIMIISIPVAAWLMTQSRLGAYTPVSSSVALYIGAGHRSLSSETYEESVEYMYFETVDANNSYSDHVFCVYGTSISGFKLQLAYTTNNQFDYEIFTADELPQSEYDALPELQKSNYVPYTTHGAEPSTWYYTANGEALAGIFLNKQTVSGEDIATDEKHDVTYGDENGENVYGNVNKFAEPIYWQTTNVIKATDTSEFGGSPGFIRYFILRVYTNEKNENDRETDVICIAAKSFAYSGS